MPFRTGLRDRRRRSFSSAALATAVLKPPALCAASGTRRPGGRAVWHCGPSRHGTWQALRWQGRALIVTAFGLGAAVGLTLALTGAGGGVVVVPLLVFALKLDVAEAAPVGLLAVGLAAALGAADDRLIDPTRWQGDSSRVKHAAHCTAEVEVDRV
jgi:hypothetical protein